jgi:hypothetical protein
LETLLVKRLAKRRSRALPTQHAQANARCAFDPSNAQRSAAPESERASAHLLSSGL